MGPELSDMAGGLPIDSKSNHKKPITELKNLKRFYLPYSILSALILIVLTYYTNMASSVITAIIIMLSYIAIVKFIFKTPIISYYPVQFGDSIYYLGFLFTLTSLAASIIFTEISPNIDKILSNLGVALITTILGLILRNHYTGFMLDEGEVEYSIKSNIADNINGLHKDFKAIRESFKKSSNDFINTLDKSSKNISMSVQQNMQSRIDSSNKILKNADSFITRLIKGQNQTIEAFVNTTTSEIEKITQELQKQLKSLQKPAESIDQEIGKTFIELNEKLKKDTDPIIASVQSKLLAINETLRTVSEQMEVSANQVKGHTELFEQNTESLSATIPKILNQFAIELRNSTQRITPKIEGSFEIINSAIQEIESEFKEAFASYIKGVGASETPDKILDRKIGDALEGSKHNFSEFENIITETTDVVNNRRKSLDEFFVQMGRINDLLGGLSKGIGSLTTFASKMKEIENKTDSLEGNLETLKHVTDDHKKTSDKLSKMNKRASDDLKNLAVKVGKASETMGKILEQLDAKLEKAIKYFKKRNG